MESERRFAGQLSAAGWSTGLSRNGRLLRVDNRSGPTETDPQTLARIVRCPALRELYLRPGPHSVQPLAEAIAALEKLKVLDLEGSDFDDRCLNLLRGLRQLQVLNVRDTQVSGECVAGLRKTMIGTRIIF
jgi:hypothetical protein